MALRRHEAALPQRGAHHWRVTTFSASGREHQPWLMRADGRHVWHVQQGAGERGHSTRTLRRGGNERRARAIVIGNVVDDPTDRF